MSDPLLIARAVRKTFPSGDRRLEILRGVDLSVGPGESVSISGESGSGKSTLLNLLAGLDVPDSGGIKWSGCEKIDYAARARFLGFVFQSFHLIPELDARENVLMAARIRGKIDQATKARADELLARVGLAERKRHLPAKLSGGERQRVAVARALLNRPQLILADEPTGNLDEHTGESVVGLLLSLCAEAQIALVLVTHNVAHAERCGKRLRLHDGVQA